MARRLLTPFLRAIGADGLALSGAKIYFYTTGTTTPTDSYQASSGGSAHANPVVADSGGLFASIYINDAIQTRAVLKNSAGTTILDIDPVNPVIAVAADSITDTELAAGAAVANLGYTPANVAGDTFTGAVKMSGTPTSLATTDLGFRGVPLTTHDATYTFVIDDAGKGALHTSGSAHTWTIPPVSSVAYPAGSTIVLVNTGAGAVTIARGAGVALRIAGASTDGSKTLAQYGIATLFMPVADTWYISGAGVS
jgi:hypothetical protein